MYTIPSQDKTVSDTATNAFHLADQFKSMTEFGASSGDIPISTPTDRTSSKEPSDIYWLGRATLIALMNFVFGSIYHLVTEAKNSNDEVDRIKISVSLHICFSSLADVNLFDRCRDANIRLRCKELSFQSAITFWQESLC